MSIFNQKSLKNKNKAIKMGIILILALFGSFFISNEARAGIDINEDFENYEIENLTNQGNWETGGLGISCKVDNERSFSGNQALKSRGDVSYYYCSNEREVSTTTSGIVKSSFWIENTTDFRMVFRLGNPDYYLESYATTDLDQGIGVSAPDGGRIILSTTSPSIEEWHTIWVEYNLIDDWFRGKLDNGEWSNSTTTGSLGNYLNYESITIGGDVAYDYFIDKISYFGSELICENFCEFCYTETACLIQGCYWEDGICSLEMLELPELEECEGLTITERLLCELKNFFYRLFVPSSEKITELRETLDLIKAKFPYNYILGIKDFFVYLKDNIDEEQEINFSILGQAGIVNFDFWNTTTTIAGTEQSISSIFKKFFSLIIILGFGFWSFSFLRKIFK